MPQLITVSFVLLLYIARHKCITFIATYGRQSFFYFTGQNELPVVAARHGMTVFANQLSLNPVHLIDLTRQQILVRPHLGHIIPLWHRAAEFPCGKIDQIGSDQNEFTGGEMLSAAANDYKWRRLRHPHRESWHCRRRPVTVNANLKLVFRPYCVTWSRECRVIEVIALGAGDEHCRLETSTWCWRLGQTGAVPYCNVISEVARAQEGCHPLQG